MKVVLSGTLLRFSGYQRELVVDATTVGGAIAALVERHPSLRNVLYDGNGEVRSAHLLAVNGRQIDRSELDAPIQRDDVLEVLTAIAGG